MIMFDYFYNFINCFLKLINFFAGPVNFLKYYYVIYELFEVPQKSVYMCNFNFKNHKKQHINDFNLLNF